MREPGYTNLPITKITYLWLTVLTMGVGIHFAQAQINTQNLIDDEGAAKSEAVQDTEKIESEQQDTVKLDPLTFEIDPDKTDEEADKGFFQFLKFKKNRERKEKERIQLAVKEMMILNNDEPNKNKINIEPGTVNDIESELNIIKDSIPDVDKER